MTFKRGTNVLGTLAIILSGLWLLGIVTSYTLGGLIHLLLVIAIAVVLLRLIQGQNPLAG
ncbi:MAG TPA: lmo0937 family membrane protein [Vicinamibacterales bacterium]|nr:lmo0937 family membrane protein [Vicinamibacterales bacterium]